MKSSSQVLVLEASAGSGKTYALAKRYVQLSLQVAAKKSSAIQSILAITFTNKATWAMKSRILDFFKRIALKQLNAAEVLDIITPLGLDEDQASTLGFNLMNDVIRQYHYFQVQTIDSFVNILLIGCSFKIGLSARFKIQRNSKEYLQLSLDELLDEASHDEKIYQLFNDFVRQYLYLENRSGWFPKDDLLKVMGELFRQYNTYQKPYIIYPLTEEFFLRKRKIFSLVQELHHLCPPQTSKRFLEHLEKFLTRDVGAFDVDDLKSYWAREEFPINKGGEVSLHLEKLWGKIHQEIYGLCLQEALCMFNPYVVLFEKVLTSFGQLSRRDDVLFLEELNRKAAHLFEEGLVTVEELYFRLAARLEHFLMDEFQDTSMSQWRNISLLVQEALAQGGSLFYVGDKKQAIYAFRGGESQLFDALQVELADFNVQTARLEKNYRSCEEIINFNNRIFSDENLREFLYRRQDDAKEKKRDDIQFAPSDFGIIANTFAHSRQRPGKELPGGHVQVSSLAGRTKEERDIEVHQKLIVLINELRDRFALKDIAILTRGNRELEEITQWLLQEGIYASSERSSDIKNNPLINELIHLFKFLHSPMDNNVFAQFCLGELMPKATGIDTEVLRHSLFIWARQAEKNHELYFFQEFQEAFPEVWNTFFAGFFLQVGVFPVYELAAGLIERFGCENHFPHYQGFLMHLLELIKRQEIESCDLSSFLDYFDNFEGEDRFVPMAQVDAIKVLTVHKSKGLEFPVVIVPYLEMDIKAGSGGRDGSPSYILDIQEEGMNLIRIKESYRQFCPELQERYEEEYRKAFLVELNSTYVALTRAIEELYVFVPAKVGNAVNPAKFLIPEDCLNIGMPRSRPLAHEISSQHMKIRPFMADPWIGLQEEFLDHSVISVRLARLGKFYHDMLMCLGNLVGVDIDQELQRAWDMVSHSSQSSDAKDTVIRYIQHFITREDVRPYFFLPEDAVVFCEKEFVNKYGDTKRIDRLIILKDEVWVIDFKMSPGDEHQKQLQGYMDLLASLYPGHQVSGHVLYYQ